MIVNHRTYTAILAAAAAAGAILLALALMIGWPS